jgi:DNA-binding transcriptional ArsR family regulator
VISFEALSSPRRREILRVLWNGEAAAGDIHAAMPDVTFGAVSQHLKRLMDAGAVDCRREHRSRIYRVRREALGPIGEALERMWSDTLWRLKLRAELEHSRRGPRPARRRTRRKPS